MNSNLLKLFILIVLGGYTLYSCSNSKSTTSTTTAATSASEGTAATASETVALADGPLEKARVNYTSFCSGCHGEKAATFADRRWKFGNTDADIFKSIKFGHPEAGMPAFQEAFTDQQIEGLVAYIRQGIASVQEYSFEKRETLPETFETEELSFRLETVATGLGVPWGMAFLPDGDMLITSRAGTLYRSTKSKELQKVSGNPEVLAEGQGGLMDVALDPDFKQNNLVYLSYSAFKKEDGNTVSTTAVMQARLQGNQLTNQKVIFEALPYSRTRHHYGSRIAFGKDGNLYVSVGDRGNHDENPQDLTRYPGKIHRIKPDGSIPADNPFVKKQGAVGSIFTYGHRNPQGMAFNPKSGELWANEHGPRGGDEVNIIRKGNNYGWVLTSYGINYNGKPMTDKTTAPGITDPIYYWVPSIAPSGMAFVTGNRYKGWEGDVMVGSLRFHFLSRCKVEGNKITGEEKLLKNIGRVRDVRMGPDDYLYVAVENGNIYKIVPVEEANN